ncbi:hypothetical protein R1flu_012757 [Riccia fluitans]|uniref:Uncharacterized protein n=1 Tax=Riccia fluitans TaxID=41844 RepID=A0ABD1ZCJ6_9MARC
MPIKNIFNNALLEIESATCRLHPEKSNTWVINREAILGWINSLESGRSRSSLSITNSQDSQIIVSRAQEFNQSDRTHLNSNEEYAAETEFAAIPPSFTNLADLPLPPPSVHRAWLSERARIGLVISPGFGSHDSEGVSRSSNCGLTRDDTPLSPPCVQHVNVSERLRYTLDTCSENSSQDREGLDRGSYYGLSWWGSYRPP